MSGQPREDPRVPVAEGMPMLGLGTWRNDDPEQCADSVETALRVGYRHVDTAKMYRNEAAVGDGLAAADVDAEEVFVATKVWHDSLAYDDVIESAESSRADLGVGAIDLLYVHWPAGSYDPEETLAAFADLRDDGVIDRVGVSNFEPAQLDEAIDRCDAPIFANQVECHPLLQQEELRSYCDERDINLVAYAPLGRGELFDVPELVEIAETYDASVAQVSLAWLREKGITAVPKATGEDHIRENFQSLALELDDEDVARIDGLDREERIVDPPIGPW